MINWDWTPSELERRERVKCGETVLANCGGQGCDKRLIEWATANGLFVYIDRPGRGRKGSIWGNPFKLGPDGDRDAVCERYRAYLEGSPDLLSKLESLRGKVLGCWCYPERCHGGILIERLETKE
jgi:hypothetical protein